MKHVITNMEGNVWKSIWKGTNEEQFYKAWWGGGEEASPLLLMSACFLLGL